MLFERYGFVENSPPEGESAADVFGELGLYTVAGSRGREGSWGGAVTDEGGWYTGERGLARRCGLDAGERVEG